jgi:hypothetical protein
MYVEIEVGGQAAKFEPMLAHQVERTAEARREHHP